MRLIRRRKGEIVSHGGVDMRIVATPEFDTLTLQGPDGEYLNVSLADLQAEHSGKVKVHEVVDVVRQEKIPGLPQGGSNLCSTAPPSRPRTSRQPDRRSGSDERAHTQRSPDTD